MQQQFTGWSYNRSVSGLGDGDSSLEDPSFGSVNAQLESSSGRVLHKLSLQCSHSIEKLLNCEPCNESPMQIRQGNRLMNSSPRRWNSSIERWVGMGQWRDWHSAIHHEPGFERLFRHWLEWMDVVVWQWAAFRSNTMQSARTCRTWYLGILYENSSPSILIEWEKICLGHRCRFFDGDQFVGFSESSSPSQVDNLHFTIYRN